MSRKVMSSLADLVVSYQSISTTCEQESPVKEENASRETFLKVGDTNEGSRSRFSVRVSTVGEAGADERLGTSPSRSPLPRRGMISPKLLPCDRSKNLAPQWLSPHSIGSASELSQESDETRALSPSECESETSVLISNILSTPALTVIDASYTPLGGPQMVALAEDLHDRWLAKELTSLHTLNLRSVNAGLPGALALAKAIKVAPNLREIDFSCNCAQPRGVQAIAEACMESASRIRVLKINVNQAGVRGMRALAKLVQHSDSLVELQASLNRADVEGARAMAHALRYNRSLEVLGYSYNNSRAAGILALADAIGSSSSLWALDLRYNRIDDECANECCKKLEQTRSLCDVLLGGSKRSWPGLKATLQRNRILNLINLHLVRMCRESRAVRKIINSIRKYLA